MSAEVIEFSGVSKLDIPAERILRNAIKAELENVVVIGWDKDSDFYFAGSYAAGPETLWLLELAKAKLLKIGGADDDA